MRTTTMNVHLVGSIGLDSVEEVFSTVGPLLGKHVKRIPDGEVGPRRLWVSFQYPLLRSSPYLRPDPSGEVRPTNKFPKLCLAEGVDAAEVTFGELAYAREARGSYLDFCAARERGEIPIGVRFQVCLPTPMGVIYAFCTARDVLAIDAAYEKAMIHEVERICRAIPHQDLCIQWDFCHEMIILDGQPQTQFPTVKTSKNEIMQRMSRICAAVPAGVDLGVHLCYGDFAAKHFNEPRDMAPMVEVANAAVSAVQRRIQYIHMPVPISRSDEAYFAPLKNLKFDGELYLGVVHAADGIEGTKKRMSTARKFAPKFGIACECGIARARKPEVVKKVLELHAAAAE